MLLLVGSTTVSGLSAGTGEIAFVSPFGQVAGAIRPAVDGAGREDRALPDETASARESGQQEHPSSLSDEGGPLALDGFPARPKPLLELGEPFLGTGTLERGFRLPTGAVWQPAFLAFGTLRVAAQTFERGDQRTSEIAGRLDLFGNLQLSGTERLVIGFRNLDRDGRFTSYVIDSNRPGDREGGRDEFNGRLESLFFEGDFGEIFPTLSRDDSSATDWGFSIGRQPLVFQEGLVVQDTIDALGLTRNTLLPKRTSNVRATLLVGWNDIDRTDHSAARANREDDDALLLGLFTSTDVRRSTLDVDLVWVADDSSATDGAGSDLMVGGLSAVQRVGLLNTSFRVAFSRALDRAGALASDGVVVFGELSWTPRGTHDLVYATAFLAIDDYVAAARDPSAGGPLGRAGIGFAAVGLGSFGAPLSNQAREVGGGAFGRQWFFDDTRKQVVAELGVRIGTAADVLDEAAITVRFQSALGRRFVWLIDAFGGYREASQGITTRSSMGARFELVTKF
jgi:hypothetical protein